MNEKLKLYLFYFLFLLNITTFIFLIYAWTEILSVHVTDCGEPIKVPVKAEVCYNDCIQRVNADVQDNGHS